MTEEQTLTSPTIDDTEAVTPAPAAEAPKAPAPETEGGAEAPAQSLEDALSERYDAIKAEGGDESDDDDSLEIPRDAQGRFASRNPETADPEAQAEGVDQPPDSDSEEQDSEAPAIPLPNSWSPELAEKWAEVPSEVQEYVAQREHQAHSTISRMGQALKAYEPLHRVFEEQAHTFERYGVDPVTWVSNLSKVQDQLDSNPVAGIKWLADYYAQQAGYQSGDELLEAVSLGVHQDDPRLQQAQQQQTELQRRAQMLERQNQELMQRQQYQQWHSVRSGIDQVAADKPHFDELIPDIVAEIPGLRQMYPQASESQLLDAAYERARWANPKTRAIAMQAESQKAAEARKAEAAKAKRINRGNVRGQPVNGRISGKDLDDILSKTYDQLAAS